MTHARRRRRVRVSARATAATPDNHPVRDDSGALETTLHPHPRSLGGGGGPAGLTTTITFDGALTRAPSLARSASVTVTGIVVSGASNATFAVSAPARTTFGPSTCRHWN